MYPLIRVDKRIPDGSIWQARRAYLLPPVHGWTRAFGPAGTRWSNPLGGWTTTDAGISLFHPDHAFTISCHGPDDAKRFYIDVAHRVTVGSGLVEFVDLFLDVLIDADGTVSEKDEHQLTYLPRELRVFARESRDRIRSLIAARDPLFDPASAYFSVPDEARGLTPARGELALR